MVLIIILLMRAFQAITLAYAVNVAIRSLVKEPDVQQWEGCIISNVSDVLVVSASCKASHFMLWMERYVY